MKIENYSLLSFLPMGDSRFSFSLPWTRASLLLPSSLLLPFFLGWIPILSFSGWIPDCPLRLLCLSRCRQVLGLHTSVNIASQFPATTILLPDLFGKTSLQQPLFVDGFSILTAFSTVRSAREATCLAWTTTSPRLQIRRPAFTTAPVPSLLFGPCLTTHRVSSLPSVPDLHAAWNPTTHTLCTPFTSTFRSAHLHLGHAHNPYVHNPATQPTASPDPQLSYPCPIFQRSIRSK